MKCTVSVPCGGVPGARHNQRHVIVCRQQREHGSAAGGARSPRGCLPSAGVGSGGAVHHAVGAPACQGVHPCGAASRQTPGAPQRHPARSTPPQRAVRSRERTGGAAAQVSAGGCGVRRAVRQPPPPRVPCVASDPPPRGARAWGVGVQGESGPHCGGAGHHGVGRLHGECRSRHHSF